jgi:hypothetical protein
VLKSNTSMLPVAGNKPNRNMTADEFKEFNDIRKATVEKFINAAIKRNVRFGGKDADGVSFNGVHIQDMTSEQLKSKLKTWEGQASKIAKSKILAKK